MTKGAVEVLARQLAGDLGPREINVNVVAPGAVATDMSPELRDAALSGQVLQRQAMARVAKPEDIADAVAMLFGHDARWITGAVIPVSGGTLL